MGGQPESEFGPQAPAARVAAPFSVTGPTSVSLDGARHGVASFVVTNTSGRPLTARLLPQGLSGAASEWLSVVGEMERPIGVAATLTVDVAIDVPPDVPPGDHALRLDVAVEAQPDWMTAGQAVSFTIPAQPKKGFPRWIILVVVLALLAIGVGVWAILRATADSPPVALTPPVVTGEAVVGQELSVAPGTWDDPEAALLYRWQSCPGTATDTDPQGCEDIVVEVDGVESLVPGESLVAGPDVEGRRLRVIETAVVGDLTSADLEDLANAAQPSALTPPIAPAPPETVPVPDVKGTSVGDAQAALAAVGLQALVTRAGAGGTCDPAVESQNPIAGTEVTIGSPVAITTLVPPPIKSCFVVVPFDDFGWQFKDFWVDPFTP